MLYMYWCIHYVALSFAKENIEFNLLVLTQKLHRIDNWDLFQYKDEFLLAYNIKSGVIHVLYIFVNSVCMLGSWQIIVCHLIGAKQLSKPFVIVTYCDRD